MRPRLVLAALMPRDVIARARNEFDALVAPGPDDMTADEVIAAATAHRADAIQFVNTLSLTARAIARLPASVRVGATSSVGYDHIDVAAAMARGLVVTNTPGVLSDCTADFAFMMLLAAARRAHEYDTIMRRGWRYRVGQGDLLGVRVSGKTLGLLGMGGVGGAMARRARGFDMRILYHSRNRLPPQRENGAAHFADFHAMLPHCDFLSLHAPATPATDRIINARTLALLPRGAVLVNVARGGLVDEDALYDALTSGQLFAAGLDVFRAEPDFDTRFATLPNVILSPHIGSGSVETRNAMGYRALDNIAAVLDGRGPIDPLWT
ncbi:MAG TPA: D-glycerate dehydrogenase [Acetobacteraceae bacterium]|jgi:lactate dehydrogenase-like 2-hydroxyacid dehydrogenase|nr:D-glycerate dehydrogenase [Acetobacteraceae bacterium]